MRITGLHVSNIFSFKDAGFSLEDYNVMVGPNASGKTNFIRLINFIVGNVFPESGEIPTALDNISLSASLKFDQSTPSDIVIRASLSETERNMLARLLTNRPEAPSDKRLSELAIYIRWPFSPDDSTKPQFVLVQFGNGLTIMNRGTIIDFALIPELNLSITEINKKFLALPRITANNYGNYRIDFQDYHGVHPDHLFRHESFITNLLNGSDMRKYFHISSEDFKLSYKDLYLTYDQSRLFVAQVYEFCKIQKSPSININLWLFLRCLLRNRIVTSREIRPQFDALAMQLLDLEKEENNTWKFAEVKKRFSELFKDVQFDIPKRRINGNERYFVRIVDSGKRFDLKDSASGYYEALSLFSELVSEEDSILILDEPALRLHPIRVRLLGKILTRMMKRQVLLVTHSPYFVNANLLEKGNNLIYVRRDGLDGTVSISKPSGFVLRLRKHLLDREIFFSRISLLVEGQGDEAAMLAISDALDNVLDQNDVKVVYMGGKSHTEKYLEVLEAYHVDYVIMVDSDYTGKITPNIKKLPIDLEDQLRKIGWAGNSKKIEPDDAYDFVSKQMKSNRAVVRSTELAQIFDSALAKAGLDPKTIW